MGEIENTGLEGHLADKDGETERLGLEGRFVAECYGADGELRWRDEFPNTVVTVGKNLALDTILAGSAYTVVGPYMGSSRASPTRRSPRRTP